MIAIGSTAAYGLAAMTLRKMFLNIKYRMRNIQESVSKKRKAVKDTLEEYKAMNVKLKNGLDVSLNIIVDLSKMLKHYHELLNAIQTFVDDPIDLADDVKDLAAKAYGKLTSTFNEQIDDVISAYDEDSEEISKLESIKVKINEALKDNNQDNQGNQANQIKEDDDKSTNTRRKSKGLKFTSLKMKK